VWCGRGVVLVQCVGVRLGAGVVVMGCGGGIACGGFSVAIAVDVGAW
jgi:hypothetical protein